MNPFDNKQSLLRWKSYHRAMTKRGIILSFQTNLEYSLAKDQYTSTAYDQYMALAYSLRDRIVERWIATQQSYHKKNVKRVYYLSLEFLMGRSLQSNVCNLGLEKQVQEAFDDLGLDYQVICDQEKDAGLGNGGLGRLAACFMDSLATLAIPAQGYGIRYDYGIFQQQIHNGFQVERPDEWLKHGYPWEFCRPEYGVQIKFYGRSESYLDASGKTLSRWVDTEDILAVPYDIPIVGYKNNVVNTLRLWSARSTEEFDLRYFNEGDYEQAVYQKILSENISKVLYPNDDRSQGRELRLKQEYFFTAAALSDILRRFKSGNTDLRKLSEKVAIQLNDTHPALAIVELMRILIDDHCMNWQEAWDITRQVFSYTNHTLLPEALECWSVELFQKVLPRHLEIIYEINQWFLDEVSEIFPGDGERMQRLSLIQEGPSQKVRMAHLCIIGSKKTNGVSKLHSELLKTRLFSDFFQLNREKFCNKTNGIAHRRWLLTANEPLSNLITSAIGEQWIYDPQKLQKLKRFKQDASFLQKWQNAKAQSKKNFVDYMAHAHSIILDPHSMFDVQIKRIHEYKRQLLFGLYIISEYLKIKNTDYIPTVSRTFMVGGKAAPGYALAKLIIKFLNNVAGIINDDPKVRQHLKLVFLDNYNVTLAEKVIPASNLSEQISTAGMEASGTGNMKFMFNGALTIGTMDGANIEICENVGKENMFIFGLKAQEVERLRSDGYNPASYLEKSYWLKEIYTLMIKNYFCMDQFGLFDPIIHAIFDNDQFMICADFDDYCRIQEDASRLYQYPEEWTKKSIANVASAGFFTSDRTIREYAKDIWDIKPLHS